MARVLKKYGITKKVARRKSGRKKSYEIARLQLTKAHQSWTIAEWNKVLFSDESNFNTRKQSARLQVSRRIGEAYTPQSIAYTFSSGKISCSMCVYVSVCVSGGGGNHWHTKDKSCVLI